MATIQGVYIALFGRPADPAGLAFFNTATQNGANLTAIGNLASTPEYQNRFVGQNNASIVTSIYQSLYNRAPDVPGLNFFVAALTNNTLNINNIAIAIYDGALGSDLTIRNLKEAAANAFTTAIDTAAEITGYNGTAAAAVAVSFLTGVTVSAPSAAQVDAAVLAATTATTSTVTITLTNQIGEQVVGTAANETFNGVLNAANPSSTTGTFNTGDSVNGGAGTDTLNLTVTTAGAVLPAGATVSNIEIVNINQSAATATGITPTSFAGVQQLWQIDTTAAGGTFQDVTAVNTGVTIGFRGNGQVVNNFVTAADKVTSLSIALDGIANGSAVGTVETTPGDLKTVSVSGSGALNGNFANGVFATGIETFNVSLSTNTIYSINQATPAGTAAIKEVNFGGSTGDITFNSSAYTTAFTTLTGGSGKDTLTANNSVANAPTLTVNAGAGADLINFTNTKSAVASISTLTGGAGGDTFALFGAGNLVAAGSAANLTASMTRITDFSASEDTLNITGLALGARVAQNTVNAAALGADIFAVTTAVAAITAPGQHAFFQFAGDTYLYGNISGAGLGTTDALIQLVGVSVASLTAANVIG